MPEYIEREATLRGIERREALMVGDKLVSVNGMKTFIENRPAADVVPVRHGEWILGHVEPGYFTPGGNRPWICSKCKQVVSWSLARPEYNYCRNCGAKMEGGDE